MENLLNLSLLEGRLTRDPELTGTKNGHAVCKFDIAVNRSVKHGDEYTTIADFFTVNTWDKVANACSKFLKKGSKVRVKGKLKQDSWEAKDGSKRYRTLIEANSVDFISMPKKDQKEPIPVPF